MRICPFNTNRPGLIEGANGAGPCEKRVAVRAHTLAA